MNSMKRQKDMTLEDKPPWFIGAQRNTYEEDRRNSSRKSRTKAETMLGCGCVWWQK